MSATENLILSLKTTKKTYKAGEPIPLTIQFENKNKHIVSFKDFGAGLLSTYYLGFSGYKIEGKKKEQVWFMGTHISVKAAHVFQVVTIKPGKTWEDNVDFRDWKQPNSQPLTSGTYEIIATWNSKPASIYGNIPREIEGEFKSNPITITF